MSNVSDHRAAYALLRLAFGINMATHGVNRLLSGVDRFAAKMADDFSTTVLPRFAVLSFGWVLPFVELAIGLLILAGLWMRPALSVGALVMACLMFGTALRGDWNVLGIQLIYALAYYVLLARREDDAFGIDAWRSGRHSQGQ